jgi:hypothetical protein
MTENLYKIVLLQQKLIEELVNPWDPEVQLALKEINFLIQTLQKENNDS